MTLGELKAADPVGKRERGRQRMEKRTEQESGKERERGRKREMNNREREDMGKTLR